MFQARAPNLLRAKAGRRRHLSRLEGGALPEQTGIPPGDWTRLFEYGDLVRADLRRYVNDIDDSTGSETLTFVPLGRGQTTMTRRRLLMHVETGSFCDVRVLHEFGSVAVANCTASSGNRSLPLEEPLSPAGFLRFR